MTDLNDRCPTGIPGLDELMEGGFPRNRSVLLSGTSGSGKTTFAIQFLCNGILQYNEPGILISLEQDPKELKSDMRKYGFDLDKLEKEGKLVIIDTSLARVGIIKFDDSPSSSSFTGQPDGSMSLLPDEFDIDKILEIVASKAKRIGARRVVFDSLPALDFLLAKHDESKMKYLIRQTLLAVNYRLKASNLTALLITESSDSATPHDVESYIVDGVVSLVINEALDDRTVKIKKMRQTCHTLKPKMFEFTDKGIVVKGAADSADKKKLF